jgi:hypothetical protein
MLTTSGNPCSVPALSAERPFGEGEMWSVRCAEKAYTLILGNDGTRTIMPGAATVQDGSD